MPIHEKQAWFTIGVVVLTLAAYSILGIAFGFGVKASSAFALTALAALFRRRRATVDERDREILSRSLLSGLRVFWICFVAMILVLGVTRGWDATVQMPVWSLAAMVWFAWMVVSTARSITTIVLYRSGQ